MSENRMSQPYAAEHDRPCAQQKQVPEMERLEAQYRQIGIAAVAAAAGACSQPRKGGGR